MTQKHSRQDGTFHITTNARGGVPWFTIGGVPEIIIQNLVMTRNLHRAKLYAFCILPDHMHMVISPGEKGLSRFMQSFKSHSSYDVHHILGSRSPRRSWEPWLPATGSFGTSATDNNHSIHRRVTRADHPFTGWQNGFHDERIRDRQQLDAALSYVKGNAFHHNLTDSWNDWRWSSTSFPDLMDTIDETWMTCFK